MTIYSRVFKDFKGLARNLKKLGLEKSLIDSHLEHEIAHYDMAKGLGYNPQIEFEIETDHRGEILEIATGIYVPNVTVEDNKKIALAPKNPSSWDEARAKGWGTEARII